MTSCTSTIRTARGSIALACASLLACAATPRVAPASSSASAAATVANVAELPVANNDAADSLLADVQLLAPEIRVGLRYATPNNFTGVPLPGYEGNHAFMRREAAAALARVAHRAANEGLALHVFDAYRPVRATDAMVAWTKRTGRTNLLSDGYIASRSRHNLGTAIDLTLVSQATGVPLEMGTAFDTFSDAAHTANATGDALANRRRLQRLMEAEGFVNYDQEWWHYSYDVPHPVRFDRVIGDASLPAGAADVADRLAHSPRHGEYVTIRTGPSDSVRAWVVYPERATKAPVVVLIHEIYGLSTWLRGVTDQLAADGYIAIAPDLLTGKATPAAGSDTLTQAAATAAIRTLNMDDVQRQLAAVGRYGMSLPSAEQRYATLGFCWGGGVSFAHAVANPAGLRAAIVYYGTSPELASLVNVHVPVLGLYAGDDARVVATVPPADSAMRALGKSFDPHIFPGAGHGFLRQQDGRSGANMSATRQSWPLTVAFLRAHLGR